MQRQLSLLLELLFEAQGFLGVVLQEVLPVHRARECRTIKRLELMLRSRSLRIWLQECTQFNSTVFPLLIDASSFARICTIVVCSQVVDSQSRFDSFDGLQIIVELEINVISKALVRIEVIKDLSLIICSFRTAYRHLLLHF